MGDVTGLGARIGHLGRRVLAGRRPPARVGGSRLARVVAIRHRPPLLEAATRLARGRSMAPQAARAPRAAPVGETPVVHPELSDFATDWMFGGAEPEGVPFAEGAAVPEPLQGPPSFSPSASVPVAPAPVTRGAVEEMGPFRLSRTPAPPAAEPSPEPAPEVPPAAKAEVAEPATMQPEASQAGPEPPVSAEPGSPLPPAQPDAVTAAPDFPAPPQVPEVLVPKQETPSAPQPLVVRRIDKDWRRDRPLVLRQTRPERSPEPRPVEPQAEIPRRATSVPAPAPAPRAGLFRRAAAAVRERISPAETPIAPQPPAPVEASVAPAASPPPRAILRASRPSPPVAPQAETPQLPESPGFEPEQQLPSSRFEPEPPAHEVQIVHEPVTAESLETAPSEDPATGTPPAPQPAPVHVVALDRTAAATPPARPVVQRAARASATRACRRRDALTRADACAYACSQALACAGTRRHAGCPPPAARGSASRSKAAGSRRRDAASSGSDRDADHRPGAHRAASDFRAARADPSSRRARGRRSPSAARDDPRGTTG